MFKLILLLMLLRTLSCLLFVNAPVNTEVGTVVNTLALNPVNINAGTLVNRLGNAPVTTEVDTIVNTLVNAGVNTRVHTLVNILPNTDSRHSSKYTCEYVRACSCQYSGVCSNECSCEY